MGQIEKWKLKRRTAYLKLCPSWEPRKKTDQHDSQRLVKLYGFMIPPETGTYLGPKPKIG